MSALDYRTAIQPSGTLRLSSADDYEPFQLKPYRTTFGRGFGAWWRNVIGGPRRPSPIVSTTGDVGFGIAHSGAPDPLHPGYSVPVYVTPTPLPEELPTNPVSETLVQPNIAPVIETNQNDAMETKLPSQTYIHIVAPPGSTTQYPVVIPHDGHTPGYAMQIRKLVDDIYRALKTTFGYVLFTYEDLYNQLMLWDGKVTSLLTNVHFLWRMAVTGIVTIGILEIVPLLESIFSVWWDLMELIYHFFEFLGSAVQEVVYGIRILYDDVDALWFKLTGR